MRHFVGVLLNEMAGQRGASVIDQDADTGVVTQSVLNDGEFARLSQIRRDNVDGNVIFAA